MPWLHDFFEIDLSKVPNPELEPGWKVSHGYSREQMEHWADQLGEIQRLCREQGYSHADFQRMRESADLYERDLGETYRKFYDHERWGPEMNHDCIAVEWRDDHYEILNGEHRIWVAKQRGLRHLPARVSAPDAGTLAALRSESHRIAAGEQLRQQRLSPWERSRDVRGERGPCRERM